MIIAPYDSTRDYDVLYEKTIKLIAKTLDEKDDDYLGLYVGQTGTGKSNLMLHGYELFDSKGCDVKYVGIDKRSHANALKMCKDKPDKRFCADDEANVSSRDSMTKYNKDKIDLYYAIRGLRIFHAWCNPSAQTLDKVFIKERIKGLFYVATKDIDRPRIYYFFRKQDLLKMYEKEGNLEMQTLKKHCKKYAYYKGWFRAYKGKLLNKYLENKSERMSDKIDLFAESWGGELDQAKQYPLINSAIARALMVSAETVKRYSKAMIAAGIVSIDEDWIEGASGKKFWRAETVIKFKNYSKTLRYGVSSYSQPCNLSSRVTETASGNAEGRE